MLDMQHRAVTAIRDWNARLGQDATYLVCSHGDVIKAIVADALGLHLDQCQRIQADPCSLTVIRYTPLRPFLLRMNDTRRRGRGPAAPPTLKPERTTTRPATRPSGAGPAGLAAVDGAPRGTRTRTATRTEFGRPVVTSIRGHARIGLMPVYFYDPPDRFVAGAVGQPGNGRFTCRRPPAAG